MKKYSGFVGNQRKIYHQPDTSEVAQKCNTLEVFELPVRLAYFKKDLFLWQESRADLACLDKKYRSFINAGTNNCWPCVVSKAISQAVVVRFTLNKNHHLCH